jgi:carboxyl-terminal processing protease
MNNSWRIALAAACGLGLGVAAALTAGVVGARGPFAHAAGAAGRDGPAARATLASADARRLAELMERVKSEYVDPVDDATLVDNALRGLVSGLDPYSAYLDRDEYDEVRLSASGAYPGIGVEVEAQDDGIRILRPIDDSPAARAGLRSGDVIVRIDGNAVSPDVDAAIDQMRGAPGTDVRLQLRRAGAAGVVDVALRRARVEVRSVSGAALDGGYGYLRIASFSDTTSSDVGRELAALVRAQRRPLRGLVIDLRNNPGGVLESAVDVADDFLESGVIVTADGRTADARFRMDATPGDLLHGARIVVLVNGGSASAAEILAGALRDNGRALLVGRRTYGKGSVQTVIPLSGGRALKLTTSRYATPSGAMINERGIDPDVELTGPEPTPGPIGRDPEIQRALEQLKGGPAPSPRLPSQHLAVRR